MKCISWIGYSVSCANSVYPTLRYVYPGLDTLNHVHVVCILLRDMSIGYSVSCASSLYPVMRYVYPGLETLRWVLLRENQDLLKSKICIVYNREVGVSVHT